MKYKILAKELPDGRVIVPEKGCGQGSCPAVIKRQDGTMMVVGKQISVTEQRMIEEEGVVAFHAGEIAVEISPELLKMVKSLL